MEFGRILIGRGKNGSRDTTKKTVAQSRGWSG